MPLIRDSAIVLKRLEFSESSQVLVVLTRDHGKVRVIAKGIRRSTRRRFSPGIDLLETGEIVLSVRRPGQEALAIISEWKQRQAFSGLREGLDRLHAAQYAGDIVVGLTEEWDPHPAVYDALEGSLGALASGQRVFAVLVALQQALLTETGVGPRLDRCVGCGQAVVDGDIYFSSFEGGLLCRDCEPARVEKRLVTISHQGLVAGSFATDADLCGAFDLFNYHISHVMGRPPAAHQHLLRLAAALRPQGR
ncbi:MAG: DNA repair protein RecO [Phycisphaerae bacterium]